MSKPPCVLDVSPEMSPDISGNLRSGTSRILLLIATLDPLFGFFNKPEASIHSRLNY